jgi:hypothetical protein
MLEKNNILTAKLHMEQDKKLQNVRKDLVVTKKNQSGEEMKEVEEKLREVTRREDTLKAAELKFKQIQAQSKT